MKTSLSIGLLIFVLFWIGFTVWFATSTPVVDYITDLYKGEKIEDGPLKIAIVAIAILLFGAVLLVSGATLMALGAALALPIIAGFIFTYRIIISRRDETV